jgi:hypothetical protein
VPLSVTFADIHGSTSPQTVATTWSAGDIVVVAVIGANNTQDFGTPTVTGLTFNSLGSAGPPGNGSDSDAVIECWASSAAAAGGSGNVSVTRSVGNNSSWGMSVWVVTGGPSGVGTAVINLTESANSLTVGAGSVVVYAFSDWNADGASQTISTGSGTATERDDAAYAGSYSAFSGDWVGTSAGTYSFGVTSYSGLQVADFAVEITAGGGGTDGTATPAAISVPITLPAVTKSGGGTRSPAVTSVPITMPAVVASASDSVAPAATAVPITLPAVTPLAGSTVTPAAISIPVTLPAVTATGGATGTATPSAISVPITLPAATPLAGSAALPAATAVTITLPAVTASG